MSSSNKCNKIFGQSCRENFWTLNKILTKATLEVKTRHFVTTFEGQKQRYSQLTRSLICVFPHGTLSICRDNLFLSNYVPCSVHFRAQNNSRNSTWNCNFLNMKPYLYTYHYFKAYQRYATASSLPILCQILVNLRSGSIFVSLLKITFRRARRNEKRISISAVAVRENVWEPLKLVLISG